MSATYPTAHGNAGSLTHGARPGIEPASLWILVGFLTAEPQRELQGYLWMGTGFTGAKRGRQPKGPSADEWINTIWSNHTMKYYSALKKEGNSDLCDKLEDTVLREMSQTQNDESLGTPLLWGPRYSGSWSRKWRWLPGAGGGRLGGRCLTGTQGPFGKTKTFWRGRC